MFKSIDLLGANTVLSYALIDDYKVTCAQTISPQGPIPNNSLFQACSLSKTVTAVVTLMLATQKRIDLDISINQQLKTWNIQDDKDNCITPRHCLSMTSGLCYGFKIQPPFKNYSQGSPIPSLKDILNGESPATKLLIKVYTKPGLEYAYAGAGLMVVQQLIEEVSGLSLSQLMDTDVFKALDMRHSTFACPLEESRRALAIPGFDP